MTVRLKQTGSTMIDAAALAERGGEHGTVVVAESQTAGIGRQGHSWQSGDPGGLYLSLILRLSFPPRDLPLLTMALGLAVQSALQPTVTTDIRWPNDILLDGRKLAGILVQTPAQGVAIAGIGLNVNQTSFPHNLADIATSLRLSTGIEQEKEPLLERMVAACLEEAEALAAGGRDSVLARFTQSSSWVEGKEVEVQGEQRIRGTTAGLNPDGFLLVRTATGVETILAGGVRAASVS